MAIRWDKFTLKAQEAVQRAKELASQPGNPELLLVHLLVALIKNKEGIVPPVNRQQLGIAVLGGELIGALHRFLRLQCEFVPTNCHDASSVQILVSSLQVAARRRHDSRQDAGATRKTGDGQLGRLPSS